MSRWQGSSDSGSSLNAELDDVMEAAFGPLPGQPAQRDRARAAMSVEEAQDIILDGAFDGSGHTQQDVDEAMRVLDRAAVAEAATPAPERGNRSKPMPALNDLLQRVVSKPGGRTPGFSESQDSRIDAAYLSLWTLAESRLGMPHQEAVDHARIVFLECQHVSAQANELKESFIARLEQRVAGYQAMSPLVIESRKAGGR